MPRSRSDSSDNDYERLARQIGQEVGQEIRSRRGWVRNDPRPLSREITVANPRTGQYRHREYPDSMEILQYDSNRTQPPFWGDRRHQQQRSILDDIDHDGERSEDIRGRHGPRYLDERISNMAGAGTVS
jgi:hypothetical protein